MNQGQSNRGTTMKPGNTDPTRVRTKDRPLGTDDIGLPEDTRPDDARPLNDIRPDSPEAMARRNDPGQLSPEESRRHPSDPSRPSEDDEYATRLEKVVSKIEPPGHEVKDEDILDPGHMTPGAPPVDNRS